MNHQTLCKQSVHFTLAASILVAASSLSPGQSAPEQPATQTELRIFRLQSAHADETHAHLQSLFDDVALKIISDHRTNTLIAKAPEKVLSEVETVLEALDRPEASAEQSGRDIKILALRNADANEIAHLVNQLFGDPIYAAHDQRTNTVVATGLPDALAKVEQFVGKLDQIPASAAQVQKDEVMELKKVIVALQTQIELLSQQHAVKEAAPVTPQPQLAR